MPQLPAAPPRRVGDDAGLMPRVNCLMQWSDPGMRFDWRTWIGDDPQEWLASSLRVVGWNRKPGNEVTWILGAASGIVGILLLIFLHLFADDATASPTRTANPLLNVPAPVEPRPEPIVVKPIRGLADPFRPIEWEAEPEPVDTDAFARIEPVKEVQEPEIEQYFPPPDLQVNVEWKILRQPVAVAEPEDSKEEFFVTSQDFEPKRARPRPLADDAWLAFNPYRARAPLPEPPPKIEEAEALVANHTLESEPAETRVEAPKLEFKVFVPENTAAGEYIPIRFQVRNVGELDIDDIRIHDDLPDTMMHRKGQALEYVVGSLGRGQSHETTLYARPESVGEMVNQARLVVYGQTVDEASTELHVAAPRKDESKPAVRPQRPRPRLRPERICVPCCP